MGIHITSRWLIEKEATNPKDWERHRRETAFIDVQDVRAADILVRFTDPIAQLKGVAPAGLVTGARMFEFGLAWGAGIPIVVVGGMQNVFDYLPNVTHLPDVTALKIFLSSTEPE
jgi:hypothetical protein